MTAKTHAAHDRESPRDQASQGTTTPVEPLYERVDLDRYVVMHDGPIGYIEHVHPVFVCYVGHPYPKADEVAQVHDFHDALQTVLHRAVAMRHAQ
ncbi:hypothetical protein [Microbacterium foliorum]|uniref:hypothetical protein n=1 Tax=Microbacterium foliorum TaxID=104336 RepID=UPI0020A1C0A3|nr:hypothetical protein [Microbacterium foliorum]MCP1429001.1 hypothetical protein [Microbacterium foliorum]